MLLEFLITSALAVVTQCIDCYDDSSSVPSHPVSCDSKHDACFVEFISLASEEETVEEDWNRFCTYNYECRIRGMDNRCLKLHQLSPTVQASFWSRQVQSKKIKNRSSVRDRNSYFCCCSNKSLCNDKTREDLAFLENSSIPTTYTLNIAMPTAKRSQLPPPPLLSLICMLLSLFTTLRLTSSSAYY